jgi:hypothetical protein
MLLAIGAVIQVTIIEVVIRQMNPVMTVEIQARPHGSTDAAAKIVIDLDDVQAAGSASA